LRTGPPFPTFLRAVSVIAARTASFEATLAMAHAPHPAPDKLARQLQREIVEQLTRGVGVSRRDASPRQWLHATALAVRGRMVDRWHASNARVRERGQKQVCYLSMEYLLGRQLENALPATCLGEACRCALAGLGVSLDEIIELEPDPAFGNGGLGRLAACFLDSMAHLGLPATGYGIRYEYGMFRQDIVDGWQLERPEDWLSDLNPWEFYRPERTYLIQFGGRVEHRDFRAHWEHTDDVLAVAHDLLVPGHGNPMVNTLRLWGAKPIDALDMDKFNRGNFVDALTPKVQAKTVTRLLYPSDSTPEGRELRLRQEHFFVSASVQDILENFLHVRSPWEALPSRCSIHLNDTHPALAPAELMRLLVDVNQVEWERAWEITRSIFTYTNHTLLPEALEMWPVDLMRRVVPRHLELIEEMDRRFISGVQKTAPQWTERLAIVSRGEQAVVNMGRFSALVSRKVNGVSALHSGLVREQLFPEFAQLYPDRFVNVTNGICHRLWLFQSNPELTQLLDERLEPGWRERFDLSGFGHYAGNEEVQARVREVKLHSKQRLAGLIASRVGIRVNPSAMFDVQIKRIHEYKRQLLNILGVIARWNAMKADPGQNWAPRVVIVAGKAAASYAFAKLVIKLAHDVGRRINADAATSDRLKLVFLPNYNVSLAAHIIPAADLSQQISLAGTEASGTGNMKLALNGALMLGTADGANVEIANAVGTSNVFFFGLTVEEVARLRSNGYLPSEIRNTDHRLQTILDQIGRGEFSPEEPQRFKPIVDALLHHDRFMVMADFQDYWRQQREVDAAWLDQAGWTRKAILNIAAMGPFSSDRAIDHYANDIWGMLPQVADPIKT
jgi:glycogen phosphorylase